MPLLMGHNRLPRPFSASQGQRTWVPCKRGCVGVGWSESVRDQLPQPARSVPTCTKPSYTVLVFHPPDSLRCTRAAALFTRPRH